MSAGEDRYRKQTRLIHGKKHSPHWSYKDHIVPPISASATYRLESTARGAKGFQEFANPEFNRELHTPIYIYDRLDEPSRGYTLAGSSPVPPAVGFLLETVALQ